MLGKRICNRISFTKHMTLTYMRELPQHVEFGSLGVHECEASHPRVKIEHSRRSRLNENLFGSHALGEDQPRTNVKLQLM